MTVSDLNPVFDLRRRPHLVMLYNPPRPPLAKGGWGDVGYFLCKTERKSNDLFCREARNG